MRLKARYCIERMNDSINTKRWETRKGTRVPRMVQLFVALEVKQSDAAGHDNRSKFSRDNVGLSINADLGSPEH